LSAEALILSAFGLLLLGAVVALFGNRLPDANRTIAICGAVCAGASAVLFALAEPTTMFGEKYVYTTIVRIATVSFCVMMVLWTMYIAGRVKYRTREAVALAFFSLFGACVMIGAREFVTFIVAFELTLMPMYVLGGYWDRRRIGLEGTLKQFLFSVVASALMVYGISLLYATSGSTFFDRIVISDAGPIGLLGLMMVLIGLFTKVGAVPFHFWVPDAYCGATVWALAFMSTIAKASSSIAFLKIVSALWGQYPGMAVLLAIIAVLSMVVGSFAALLQERVSRILAYSTVVNAGYIMVALIAYEQAGRRALFAAVIYALFYAFAVMGTLFITGSEGEYVKNLEGLSKRRPAAAWTLLLFCASLIGLPPLAGFFGKLYIFLIGFRSPYWIIALIAVLTSVISAFYYLRLIKASFFDKEDPAHQIAHGYFEKPGLCATLAIFLCATIVVCAGFFLGVLLDLI